MAAVGAALGMQKEWELFEGGFMQSVISGKPFSEDEWRAHLQNFHAQMPSATPSAFLKMMDERGRTSYQVLAEAISQHVSPQAAVLDVGCGDGEFAEHLRARVPQSSFVGVDISSEEIERARKRFGNGQTNFCCAEAEHLPFADATFDVVVSHMALMLIPNIDRALAEIRRVLRPGGTLAFIVNAASLQDGRYDAFVSRGHAFMRETFRSYRLMPLGDVDFVTATGIRSALQRGGRFADETIDITPVSVSADASADDILDFLLATYVFAALSGAHRLAFEAEIRDEFEQQRDQRHRVRLEMPISLVMAR